MPWEVPEVAYTGSRGWGMVMEEFSGSVYGTGNIGRVFTCTKCMPTPSVGGGVGLGGVVDAGIVSGRTGEGEWDLYSSSMVFGRWGCA